MSEQIHYSWKARDDGKYERFCHGIEASNAHNMQYDGLWSMFTGFTVVGSRMAKHSDGVDDLRRAWERLRAEVPILSARVEPSTIQELPYYKLVYSVSPNETGPSATFHTPEPSTRQELLDLAVAQRSKLGYHCPSGHLYVCPDKGSDHFNPDEAPPHYRFHIIFATPHATTDVRGSFTTLNRLLELAFSPSINTQGVIQANGAERLYPPLVYAAGLRVDGDQPPLNLRRMMKGVQAAQAQFQPPCALKHEHNVAPFQPSDPPIYTSLTLDPEQAARLTQAGRVHGTSITGVVAGVLAILTFRHNEVANAKSVSIWGAATDRRGRIPDQYKPYYSQAIWSKSILLADINTISTASQALLERGVVEPTFWKVCRDFKEDLDAFAQDDGSLAVSNELVLSGIHASGGIFESVPPAHCFYSSYGKIDNVLKHEYAAAGSSLLVDDPHCMALCHNLPVVAISSSSWKGILKVFSQHSRKYYKQPAIDAFYADMKTCFDAIGSSN